MVGATLLTFTVITVALSYVHFGTHKANIAVAMLVATFKAGAVAAIFMHLSAEKRLIYRILIFTGSFVIGLFWLTFLAWYDSGLSLNDLERIPYCVHCFLNASRARESDSWCIWVDLVEGEPVYRAGAIWSFMTAVALLIYGVWFYRKMKKARLIT